jgi:hypothetical protein
MQSSIDEVSNMTRSEIANEAVGIAINNLACFHDALVAGADLASINAILEAFACSIGYLHALKNTLLKDDESNKKLIEDCIKASALARMQIDFIVKEKVAESAQQKQQTYFMLDEQNNRIKIGKSINPISRLRQISGMAGAKLSLIAVIDDDVEQELHRKFSDLSVYGEWFLPDERIAEYIKSNCEDAQNMDLLLNYIRRKKLLH